MSLITTTKGLLLVIISAISLSACSTMDQQAHYNLPIIEPLIGSGAHVGYASHDPCIRCGEGWIFIPNSAEDAKTSYQKWLDEMEAKGFDVNGDSQ